MYWAWQQTIQLLLGHPYLDCLSFPFPPGKQGRVIHLLRPRSSCMAHTKVSWGHPYGLCQSSLICEDGILSQGRNESVRSSTSASAMEASACKCKCRCNCKCCYSAVPCTDIIPYQDLSLLCADSLIIDLLAQSGFQVFNILENDENSWMSSFHVEFFFEKPILKKLCHWTKAMFRNSACRSNLAGARIYLTDPV